GCCCLVFQTSPKYRSISCKTASRFSSESISVPARVLTVATFDQRVKVRRSSNGKSNSVDNICVVNSIETRSNPVEHLAARQVFQDADSPLADRTRHLCQVRRGDDRRDDL